MPNGFPHRFIAGLLGLGAAAAQALPVSLASYSTSRGMLGDVVQAPDDKAFSTLDPAQVAAGIVLATNSSSAAGSASGWASAQPGVLRAFDQLQVASLAGATVQERNYAGVVDSVHVSSAILPVGTPVTLHLDLAFNAAYTSSGLTNFMPVGLNATLAANDGTHSAYLYTDGPTQPNGVWGSLPDLVSATFATTVGADFSLDQRLSVDGQVSYVDGYGQTLVIDASHTARFYVDAPSGVQLISVTGHDYASASPVPEPSGAALLPVGALVLGICVRRRAQRSAGRDRTAA